MLLNIKRHHRPAAYQIAAANKKQQQKKRKQYLLSTVLVLFIAYTILLDDESNTIGSSRRLLRSSATYEDYLEDMVDVMAKPIDTSRPPAETTALFWHIPRTGASAIQHYYQCMGGMTIATADTNGGISRARELRLLRYKKPIDPFSMSTHQEYFDDDTSYTADVIFTGEPSFAAQYLFDEEHKGKFMSIFRHPVERAVSMYNYLKTATHEQRYRAKHVNMTLVEWASLPDEEDNYMVHKLVGKKHGEKVDETDLIIAKQLVKRRFVVGLTNEMDESIRRFTSVLGVDNIMSTDERITQCMEELYETGKIKEMDHPKIEEGSPEYEAVAAKNNLDILLYKFIAEEVFVSQQEQINSYIETVQSNQPSLLDAASSQGYSKAVMVAQGPGPEITGTSGQVFKLDGEPLWNQQGATFYNVLSSSKFHWNMAPYRFDSCPTGQNMFNINNGFIFHDVDPKNPAKKKSKHLSFRLQRRDVRKCQFASATCLAGGNFIMKFGKTAPEMHEPGSFTVGKIRVVAHNTIGDCTRKWRDSTTESVLVQGQTPSISGSRLLQLEKTTIDYLRQDLSSAVNPERCEKWISEREKRNDLFQFDSDQSTVHIDTPYMQIVIDVRQNKVATKKTCNFASMKVWITDINPRMLKESVNGLLGGSQGPVQAQVDGPFGTELGVSKKDHNLVEKLVDLVGFVA